MKKKKLFGWALVASMLGTGFSACTNEAEEVLTQESEIKLTSEITRSRVTSDLQSEQLEEGRTIGVTITGSKSGDDYVNKPWTSDGEGGLSTTHTVYWANDNINVTAYHPFNEGWTTGTKTFTVSNNQSDEDNYLNSDLLFASKTSIAKTESAISLTFSHKLAKINVTLQPEYDTDAERTKLSSAVISICNTKTSTTIDLSNGTVPTEAIGDVEEITVGTGLTASAIVTPQTVSSGTKFIKVVLGSKTFYYTLSADKQLKSGYSHNYTLTVKETAVQIANSSEIKDWNDEGNTGNAEEVATVPNNQIWYTSSDENVVTPANTDAFGATMMSNIYKNGKGVITFNGNVTSIGYAFVGCSSLTSITIPNSITKIGNSAFKNCTSLSSIDIPDNVTSIGFDAFKNCSSLRSVDIPDNVTSIGSNGFEDCTSLISIDIPNNVTSIGNQAFQGCSAMTTVKIGCSVTSIPSFAFAECYKLSSIDIPNNITSIESNAFYCCYDLKSVNIGNGVLTIGNGAFSDCNSLENISFGNAVKSIEGSAFKGCTSLNSVSITDLSRWCNITFYTDLSNPLYYGARFYLNNKELIEMVIPDEIKQIKDFAFVGCKSFERVNIGDNVTSIGDSAFQGCSFLTSLTIGAKITLISWESFFECSSLSQIYCYASEPPTLNASLYSFPFNEYGESIPLYVPSGCTTKYSSSSWNSFFKKIVEI